MQLKIQFSAKKVNLVLKSFNLVPKKFTLMPTKFNLVPKKFQFSAKKIPFSAKHFQFNGKNFQISAEKIQFSVKKKSIYCQKKIKIIDKLIKLSAGKIQNSAEKIQNSVGKIQKITNPVDWVLSKRLCDLITMFIASTKIAKREGASHHPDFWGNCTTISHTFFILIYPVDEFSLKEMRTWSQFEISPYCFFVWCKLREILGRGTSKFNCVTGVVENFPSHRVAFRNPSNVNDGAPLRK